MSSDVLIIGAGVTGASIAYHLAMFGVGNVVVIDRAPTLGAGSTGRATGGFRAQFETAVNVRLSMLAREKLLRFEEETGVDPGFAQHGYLFLARSPEVLDCLRDALAVQHGCGATESRVISADEARAINPAIHDDAIIGGTFSPADGFIRPMEILRGYYEAARRQGVRFVFGADSRDYSAGVTVNAAGPWAAEICDVPITPLERHVVPTVPTHVLDESMPMTIWTDDGFHLRVRDGRVLLLAPPPLVGSLDALAHERVPCLRSVAIDRAAAWSGFYEMSPDRHAIVGWLTDTMFVAGGSSGHGVMHAPAIGQVAAEMIAGKTPSLDIHALRPQRFAEGDAIVSSELL